MSATAAELEEQIRTARTGRDLNNAAELAGKSNLDPVEKGRLQLLFESQCHMVAPRAYRRRS